MLIYIILIIAITNVISSDVDSPYAQSNKDAISSKFRPPQRISDVNETDTPNAYDKNVLQGNDNDPNLWKNIEPFNNNNRESQLSSSSNDSESNPSIDIRKLQNSSANASFQDIPKNDSSTWTYEDSSDESLRKAGSQDKPKNDSSTWTYEDLSDESPTDRKEITPKTDGHETSESSSEPESEWAEHDENEEVEKAEVGENEWRPARKIEEEQEEEEEEEKENEWRPARKSLFDTVPSILGLIGPIVEGFVSFIDKLKESGIIPRIMEAVPQILKFALGIYDFVVKGGTFIMTVFRHLYAAGKNP